MKINRKLIILGMALLLLLWSGNIICYENHMLKEPLFIKHYYDIKTGMSNFRLYYIQNINSQDKIVSIIFPEISQQPINFNESESNTDRRHYVLKIVTIILNYDINNIPEEYKDKVITRAQVTFSNGKIMDVDLGKIYLNNDKIGNTNLKQKSASSSSEYSGSANFSADKDIIVTGISSIFYNDLKDVLQVNINGKPLSEISFPVKLKKGDIFDVSYSLRIGKKDKRKNNAYYFTLDFLTEDLQGNKGISSCFVNYNMQSPEYYDINALRRDE